MAIVGDERDTAVVGDRELPGHPVAAGLALVCERNGNGLVGFPIPEQHYGVPAVAALCRTGSWGSVKDDESAVGTRRDPTSFGRIPAGYPRLRP